MESLYQVTQRIVLQTGGMFLLFVKKGLPINIRVLTHTTLQVQVY